MFHARKYKMNYTLQTKCPFTSHFLWIYLSIYLSVYVLHHFKRTNERMCIVLDSIDWIHSHSHSVYCERINTKNRSIWNANIIKTVLKYSRSTFIFNVRFAKCNYSHHVLSMKLKFVRSIPTSIFTSTLISFDNVVRCMCSHVLQWIYWIKVNWR